MTIQNPEKFVASLWDWHFLDECFTRNIRVSDIDGMVETNGYFLLIETKSSGTAIPIGQKRMFEALQRTKRFTVIVVWGEVNQPEKMQLFCRNGKIKMFENINQHWLTNFVAAWFQNADSKPNRKSA